MLGDRVDQRVPCLGVRDEQALDARGDGAEAARVDEERQHGGATDGRKHKDLHPRLQVVRGVGLVPLLCKVQHKPAQTRP